MLLIFHLEKLLPNEQPGDAPSRLWYNKSSNLLLYS